MYETIFNYYFLSKWFFFFTKMLFVLFLLLFQNLSISVAKLSKKYHVCLLFRTLYFWPRLLSKPELKLNISKKFVISTFEKNVFMRLSSKSIWLKIVGSCFTQTKKKSVEKKLSLIENKTPCLVAKCIIIFHINFSNV